MDIKPILNTVVNVESREEYDELMRLLEDSGFKWGNNKKPTDKNNFYYYGRDTCINISQRYLLYAGRGYYARSNRTIITLKQLKEKFMTTHNNPDYKAPEMKYKQGDILVSRDGYYCRVLAVVGELYFLSYMQRSLASAIECKSAYNWVITQRGVDKDGYKLAEVPSETVEILGKKYNKDEVEKRLKELSSLDD